MKTTLCISRHSPYGGFLAREALDATLAAATFDLPLSVLFMDEGVWQLVNDQRPSDRKNQGKALSALALFGIETVYVHQGSLEARGLGRDDLCASGVNCVDDDAVTKLLEQHDHCLSF